jgi:hypothetical protein
MNGFGRREPAQARDGTIGGVAIWTFVMRCRPRIKCDLTEAGLCADYSTEPKSCARIEANAAYGCIQVRAKAVLLDRLQAEESEVAAPKGKRSARSMAWRKSWG